MIKESYCTGEAGKVAFDSSSTTAAQTDVVPVQTPVFTPPPAVPTQQILEETHTDNQQEQVGRVVSL